jgi:ribonuclease T2
MRMFLSLIALSVTTPALAQGPSCLIPKTIASPRVETPPRGQVKRVPVRGNTLALSWSPQFCRENEGNPKHASQCSVKGQFGFILHGLWPEGQGNAAPAWCAASRPLDAALIRKHFCMTPSAQLLQHEWQKHGTCATSSPDRYFAAASLLYNALRWPDMNALSYAQPSVAEFAAAFSAANPDIPVSAISVQVTRGGWLDEVKICLDTNYRPRACAGRRGANPRMRLKIWRENPKALALLNAR